MCIQFLYYVNYQQLTATTITMKLFRSFDSNGPIWHQVKDTDEEV